MSSLHDACRDGDTERVRQLLDAGAPIDEKDRNGSTALMLANRAEVRKLLLDAVVKLRLEKGTSLLEKDANGMTLLMYASLHGLTEMVQLLLDKGEPQVDVEDEFGMTALMWASVKGHTEVVQLLLGKGALFDEKKNNGVPPYGGNTALMMASGNSHTGVVKLLLDAVVKLRLEKGASLHDQDAQGLTLLMHASRAGLTEEVQLLLGKGAVVDEKDEGGCGRAATATRRWCSCFSTRERQSV